MYAKKYVLLYNERKLRQDSNRSTYNYNNSIDE